MPGFWDEYKEPVGGNFVSGDEKKVLIENGIPFEITAVTQQTGKFGPEFALSVTVPNAETGEPEARTMCFQSGTVNSRDSMLKALETYLDGGGEPVSCKLEMGGRAVLIRKAE